MQQMIKGNAYETDVEEGLLKSLGPFKTIVSDQFISGTYINQGKFR